MARTSLVQTTPSAGTEVPAREYTEEQHAQIKALGEYAHTLLLPESDPYHVWELRWLNKPDTMPRYMRAAKWKFDDAKKRIKGTMEWRREYKPDLIRPDEVKIEDEAGKIVINGFDRDGRPIIYMNPGRQNTAESPRQLRHLVWCLERAKDLMPPGQESVVILIDYKTTTLRTNPSISTARKVLHILQNHYVETLGRGLVVNLPMLLNFFYKGISPFLDPITRDKIRFNPDLGDLIPKEQLTADLGGGYDYEFDHEAYWNQIIEVCGIAPDGTRVEKSETDLEVKTPLTLDVKGDGEQDEKSSSGGNSRNDSQVQVEHVPVPPSPDSTQPVRDEFERLTLDVGTEVAASA